MASRSDSWSTFLPPGVNGRCPLAGPAWPRPTISSTCWRAASSLIPSSSSAWAATPPSSRMRPSRMCSVPTYSWLSILASSWASITTRRDRSVNLSNIARPPSPGLVSWSGRHKHDTSCLSGSARLLFAVLHGPDKRPVITDRAVLEPGAREPDGRERAQRRPGRREHVALAAADFDLADEGRSAAELGDNDLHDDDRGDDRKRDLQRRMVAVH